MSVYLAQRVVALAVVALLAAAVCEAQTGHATAALCARGVQLGYNLDYAEALASFKKASEADPLDPATHRMVAASAWTAELFRQGAITVADYLGQARATLPRSEPDANAAALVRDGVRRAIELSEQRVRANPNDADAHYQLGAAYGLLASYSATVEGKVVGSFGPARRAYREHERVLELDPRRKDAGLIVGTYRYAVSALPLPLRAAAHLVGFGGDRTLGVRMVEDAAAYPGDSQLNAMFVLVLLYNREARYDDALRVIHRLQGLFPRNRLLWLEAASTALRAGRAADARAFVEEGLRMQSSDVRRRAFGEEARWKYVHGATLVGVRRAADAERELRAALDLPSRDWVRGRVHEELGKLADLAGDRPRALTEYRLADRLCGQDDDGDCTGEMEALMKRGFK
jgi:tetratricopeptide (TPR) repeat protein